MRIGIDCRTFLSPGQGEGAGVGHYTYHLIKALLQIDRKNQYVLFFDHRVPVSATLKKKNVKIVHFPLSRYKRYLPFAYSHVLVSQTLLREKLDVLHAPANVIPLQYKKPAVVTIHDLAIYAHPEWFPSKQDFSIKVLVPKSIQRAQAVIAVSQSTAHDIQKYFKIPQDRLHVIYEGCERPKSMTKLQATEILKPWQLQDTYLLYLGTLEPRKNIAGLITVFDALATKHRKRYRDIQLVIAGGKGFEFEQNYKAIQSAKVGSIRYVGYVTTQQKQALLTNALAFIFPSLYEGFGLPVLEAMAVGTPVLTSNTSSLPEVAGQAAYLMNPQAVPELKQGIDRLVRQPMLRKKLSVLGKKQASQFSWEKCARETLAVYTSVHAQTGLSI